MNERGKIQKRQRKRETGRDGGWMPGMWDSVVEQHESTKWTAAAWKLGWPAINGSTALWSRDCKVHFNLLSCSPPTCGYLSLHISHVLLWYHFDHVWVVFAVLEDHISNINTFRNNHSVLVTVNPPNHPVKASFIGYHPISSKIKKDIPQRQNFCDYRSVKD